MAFKLRISVIIAAFFAVLLMMECGPAFADSRQIEIPAVWQDLLSSGRSLEVSADPAFEKLFFAVESDRQRNQTDFNGLPSLTFPKWDEDTILFWRIRDRKSHLRIHPGLMTLVPGGAKATWIDFGVDATPNSRWEIRASEIGDGATAGGLEKTYFFSGNSVLLKPQPAPWMYRILPANGDPAFKRVDAGFIGLRITRATASEGGLWRPESPLYPKPDVEAPAFTGPFAAIIDAREPTRETVSSVRFLVKYLREDLTIKRDLEFNVSGAKSIGGAIRIEDVSMYPGSIFADFEWHGINASYTASAPGQPPEVIKHVFGGFGVGYDLAKFWSKVEQNQVALHIGPQISLASVPVTADFEPKGFVGVRIQPQMIRLGSLWYGNLQAAKRADGSLTQYAAGYMNCRNWGICLSGEAYGRNLTLQSGANETRIKETGVALGAGANF